MLRTSPVLTSTGLELTGHWKVSQVARPSQPTVLRSFSSVHVARRHGFFETCMPFFWWV